MHVQAPRLLLRHRAAELVGQAIGMSSTHGATSLPDVINKLLIHPEPEIRLAVLHGLILLADNSSVSNEMVGIVRQVWGSVVNVAAADCFEQVMPYQLMECIILSRIQQALCVLVIVNV